MGILIISSCSLSTLVCSLIPRVDNFRPGALDRLGLGYETLAQTNPRIIHASVSGIVTVAHSSLTSARLKGCQDTERQGPGKSEQDMT